VFRSRATETRKLHRTKADRQAIALHAKGIEQPIVADDHRDSLIWRQSMGEAGFANVGWIVGHWSP